MDRGRILYVIEGLGLGGAERLLVETLRVLDRAQWSVSVVALCDRHQLVPELRNMGIPVSAFQCCSMSDYWQAARWLVRHLRAHPVDILHSHLFTANLLSRWVRAHVAPHPRLVTTLHNPDYTDDAGRGWRLHLRKSVDAWSARSVDQFVAVSKYVSEDYRQQLGLHNVEVVHNGVNLERLRTARPAAASIRAELCLVDDAFLFVHVGRCSEQKGPRVLLDAFARVAQQHADAHLLYVGDGPLRDELSQRLNQHDLEGRVTWWPHRLDVPEILAAADLFVFPSLFEGFGLGLVEAMGAGLPVIATRVGGILEIVRDRVDGWLVNPRDVSGLAEAMSQLLMSPQLRHQLGTAAQERVEARFEISVQARHLENIYRRVMAASVSRALPAQQRVAA